MYPKLEDELPLAVASMSLGRAVNHDLASKLKVASEAGFKGVEVFYEDLKIPAKRAETGTFEENLLKSAENFRSLCDKYNLEAIVLQPFKNYDGLVRKKRHDEKIEKLKLWFKLAKILRTDLILVSSNFHSDPAVTTGDEDKIVEDLLQVADLGLKENPPIRFAYEITSWGAHVYRWQHAWHIVKRVNRSNFGMCLDTYQILATVWADPTADSGLRPDADRRLDNDLAEFIREVSLDKVYFIQLADAARLSTPLTPDHPWCNSEQKPELTWSRNARLFPFEANRGGYLPIVKMLEAWIVDWGYRGWVSMEIYDRSSFDPNPAIEASHAYRGVESWKKCIQELQKRFDCSDVPTKSATELPLVKEICI